MSAAIETRASCDRTAAQESSTVSCSSLPSANRYSRLSPTCADRDARPVHERRDDRGAHAAVVVAGLGGAKHAAVGEVDGGAQPIAVERQRLVDAKRPGKIDVVGRAADERRRSRRSRVATRLRRHSARPCRRRRQTAGRPESETKASSLVRRTRPASDTPHARIMDDPRRELFSGKSLFYAIRRVTPNSGGAAAPLDAPGRMPVR